MTWTASVSPDASNHGDEPEVDVVDATSGVAVAERPDGGNRRAGGGADTPDPGTGPTGRQRILAGLLALLLLGGFAAWRSWPEGTRDVREGTTLVDEEGLIARYGIKVTLIGASARGGIVDFRYQVVDPDKASPVVHDDDYLPILIAEDTGQTIGMTAPTHHHNTELELGGTYFFLMANASNAIRPGVPVTLVIGDTRIEHIIAQG
jgi:hypothetical protein